MPKKTSRKADNFWNEMKRMARQGSLNFSLKRFLFYLCFLLSFCLPLLVAQVSLSTPVEKNSHIATVTTTELITQGQKLYQEQQFEQAEIIWQQVVKIFTKKDDRINQAMALSNLALIQQQLGQWEANKKAIAESLKLLKDLPQTHDQQRILAATLDIQGQEQLATGETVKAIQTWQQVIQINQAIANPIGVMQGQINQAQAWQDLGQYPKACQMLVDALALKTPDCQITETHLQNLPNNSPLNLQAIALRSLGNVLRVTGQTEISQQVLIKSFQLTKKVGNPQELAKVYLSLGNTARALGNQNYANKQLIATDNLTDSVTCIPEIPQEKDFPFAQQAATCYQQAIINGSKLDAVHAQINLLSLFNQTQQWPKITPLIAQIQTNLALLPLSQAAIASQLKLVQNLMCLQLTDTARPISRKDFASMSPVLQQCPVFSPIQPIFQDEDQQPFQIPPLSRDVESFGATTVFLSEIPSLDDINQFVILALKQAQSLGDQKNEVNAWGYLGAVAQQKNDLKSAEQFTQQALKQVSAYNFPDLTYRWQWQLGRLSQRKGETQAAISAYSLAYQSLQSLRQEIVTTNREIQFTFRDGIEPVYREFVDLLLQKDNPSQETLEKARDIIESLQLAELNNFFQEACLEIKTQKIDQIDPHAAVIYGIVLPERLAVILSSPGKPLQFYATAKASNSEQGGAIIIEKTVDSLFATLNPYIASIDPLQPNRNLYNWLIRPAEAELAKNKIKTLVFVLDDVLRGIPVSALHDGKQYLIEKYNVALTPGLQLFSSQPFAVNKVKVLVGGLTESRQGFAALPGVKKEVEEIATLASAKILLDENFTRDRLENQIQTQDFPVVHLATHGQFSSKAEETFLITWDERINVKNLDKLLREQNQLARNPIELLILSACQTALGDKRAALGLAGVAVRSGARSTLATLWSIQDQSTSDLMTQFYQALSQSSASKAEALRQAQLSLLRSPEYQHPYYWAPFVLVGNWL